MTARTAPITQAAPTNDRQARAVALRLGSRSRAALSLAVLVGLAACLWPFVLSPGTVGSTVVATLVVAALLVVVLVVVLAEVADGGIDAKAVAVLGVLSAVGAALRPLGAGTAGIETVFFLLVLAARVFGPGFGFVLGCTTLFASALLTSGVGPWLPYQMFGAAVVGLGAGLLPQRVSGRAEVLLLAAYGAVAAYAFGLLSNLSFWPFALDPQSTVSYLPGAGTATNIHRFLVFDATTSLGWDTGRAITDVVCILVLGSPLLKAFHRAARRAVFEPDVAFLDLVPTAG